MPVSATSSGRARPYFAGVLAAFLALAALLAWTRLPHTDEGHFTNAAWLLLTEGKLAMPMWTPWIPSLRDHMYVTTPLYFVGLAAWLKVFGLAFFTMRLYSVFWGAVLVTAWYRIGGRIGHARTAGVIVALFVGLNYDVINAATARYDIQAAALSAAGLAIFLTLREERFDLAILASHFCLTCACLTHPYGVFGSVGVEIFVATLDWRRIRIRHFLLAALPVVVGLGAWGIYIAKAPDLFRIQFGTNASGRLGAWRHPLTALGTELSQRYLAQIGGWQPGLPLAARAKILVLLAYILGVGTCLARRELRSRPEVKALLLYALTAFLMLTFLESNRWYIYTIHAIPLYAALTGIAAHWLFTQGGWPRRISVLAMCGFVAFSTAAVLYRARIDVQQRAFEPAASYLREHLRPGELVMSGGEFGIPLGFDRVLDDPTLGVLSGRRADFFVLSRDYAEKQASPPDTLAAQHVARTRAEYRMVFEASAGGEYYKVFERPGR